MPARLAQIHARAFASRRGGAIAAAIAVGALADQTYTQGTGNQTVDASSDFTGAVGGSWSVSGAGATIDSSGVVTIPTDTLRSGATVTVTYTNAGGAASSAFSVTVEAAASTIETQSLSTLDYGDGASFTLASARPAFQYADGGWGVVSDGAVDLSGDAPASAADANGFVANGGMVSPPLYSYADEVGHTSNNAGEQGFEQVLNSPDVTKPTYALDYLSGLNTAPSLTTSSVALATSGGYGRYVKTVRKDPLALVGGDYEITAMLDKVMLLSVVPEVPAVGSIRPPIIGEYGSILNVSDADFSRVRSFTLPTLPITIADCITYMRTQQITTLAEGEMRRSLVVGEKDYARDIMFEIVAPAALYMLHSSTSQSDREALLAGFMARAGDAYATYEAGQVTVGGAGQNGVDHLCLAVVAALCPQKTALVTACRAIRSNLCDQTRWAVEGDVGGSDIMFQTLTTGSSANHNQQPMLPEHVGFPYWTSDSILLQPNGTGSSLPTARYRHIAASEAGIAVAVLGLVSGGWEAVWGTQGTWDASNGRYATLGYLDQMRAVMESEIFYTTANRMPDYALAIWDAERATMPQGGSAQSVVATPPVQIDVDMVAPGMLTGTATGADIDYTALTDDGSEFTGSVSAITSREWRMSHDGVQWSAAETKAASDTLAFSGDMYLSERRTNASGSCPWSVTFPLYNGLDQPERNIVSGAAISAGAPVASEAPKVYAYRYDEEVGFPLYDELTAPVSEDKTILTAGVGLWSGIDNSLTTYQWQSRENAGAAADITGATGKTWERDLFSTSSTAVEIRCEVTVDDGNGNTTTATTGWLAMPEAAPAYSDDFLTDTSGDWTPGANVSVSHDAVNERLVLSFAPATAFVGASSPAIPVTAGLDYVVSVNLTNADEAGGTDNTVDVRYGTSIGAGDLGESAARLSENSTATITETITATGSTLYVTPRRRNADTSQLYINSVTVEPA